MTKFYNFLDFWLFYIGEESIRSLLNHRPPTILIPKLQIDRFNFNTMTKNFLARTTFMGGKYELQLPTG